MSIIAKYKFDSSIYADLVPIFNDGYSGYSITDEVNSKNSNLIIRTIENATNVLPTKIQFGGNNNNAESISRGKCLLEITIIDTSSLTTMDNMFRNCSELTSLELLTNWNIENVNNMRDMFHNCTGITSLEPLRNWNVENVQDTAGTFHNCSKITSIEPLTNWNVSNVKDMQGMFNFCSKITSIEPLTNWNVDNATNMGWLFNNCSGITSLEPIANWNVDNVTTMNNMFVNCSKLTTLEPLKNWNVDNVVYINNMFQDCTGLTSLVGLENWNVDNVTVAYGMLQNCTGLASLEPISNWNVDNVGNMAGMFGGCTGITSLEPISNWNVNNVKKMNHMFSGCSGITSLEPLRNWNVNNVTLIHSMFQGCTGLASLEPISNWDVNNVTDMSYMFQYCKALTSIDLSNWITSSVANMESMFQNCTSLTSLDISNFDTNNVTNMKIVFNDCNALKFLDLSNLNVNNVTNMQGLFNADFECINIRGWENNHGQISVAIQSLPANNEFHRAIISDIDITLKQGSHRISSNQIVCYIANESGTCPVFEEEYVYTKEEIDNGDGTYTVNIYAESAPEFISFKLMSGITHLVYLNTKNLTDMMDLFSGCINLKQINASSFDTSKVTNMQGLFYDCKAISDIHIANWDTGLVTNMNDMFYNCKVLKIIGIEDIDTCSLIECYRMFYAASNLTLLDLNKWDTSNLTTIWGMFQYCYGLTDIRINKWDTDKIISMGFLFHSTPISEINLNGWNTESATSMRQMFHSCPNIKFIDFSTVKIIDGCNISDMFYHDQVHPVEMILCKDLNSANKLAEVLPDRSSLSKQGIVLCSEATEEIEVTNKNWVIKPPVIAAKYKFDKTICEDCIPQLNNNYWYYIEDEVDEENENYIIRTINGIEPPTFMRFGDRGGVAGLNPSKRAVALIDVYEVRTDNLTDWEQLFRNCINLKSITSNWYGSENVISMYQVFNACHSLTTINNLNELQTSNVTTMTYMFSDCTNLTSLDLSHFNTSNVTNMTSMFSGCKSLTSLDVSNFDTTNVTNMASIFSGCGALTELNVSNWNTSNVTAMNSMFSGCTNLTEIEGLSDWDTSNVTSMESMFTNCRSLTTLNISNWAINNVNAFDMFYRCQSLISIDVSNWNVTRAWGMFNSCTSLTSITLPSIENKNYQDLGNIFSASGSLIEINFNNVKTYSMDTTYGLGIPSTVRKIYLNDIDTLKHLIRTNDIRNFNTNELCEIITPLDLDEETRSILAAKNWIINDNIIAQYTYDTNVYENCLPEFNAEFTEDKYTVSDDINEVIIDVTYEDGALWNNGEEENEQPYAKLAVRSKFIPVRPGLKLTTYEDKDLQRIVHHNWFWYDKDKKFISKNESTSQTVVVPANAAFVRIWRNEADNELYVRYLQYKLVTRTIMSNDETLPTQIAFGSGSVQDKTLCLQNIYVVNTNELTNMNHMFLHCQNLRTLNVSYFNTSKATTMSYMFAVCNKLTELDLSSFDTSNVTNMYQMFSNCNNLTSLDLSNFDTTNVTNMYCMFHNCESLTSLNVSNFDTSNVVSMSGMFQHCKLLTELDVSNFDTTNVIDMQNMFQNCKSLTSLNVSNWDTTNVTNMAVMFYGCNSLTELNVSNFDTTNVTAMNSMFQNCNALTSLDISNFNTTNVINMGAMFSGCQSLIELDVSNFDTKNVTSMRDMFGACQLLTSLDLSNWVTTNVTSMRDIFHNCQLLTSLDVSNWDTSNVTDMAAMFKNCNKLTELNVSHFDTTNVTDMGFMFNGCTVLTELDVSNFNTSNVTTMYNMFLGCDNLTSLNVSNFDTTNVTSMNGMFKHCKKLTSLDINSFNTNNVTDMNSMFWDCYELTELDLTNWNVDKVTNILGLFYSCKKLKEIKGISNWNLKPTGKIDGVFNTCQSLTHIDVNRWNLSEADPAYSFFSACFSLKYLNAANWSKENLEIGMIDLNNKATSTILIETDADVVFTNKNLVVIHPTEVARYVCNTSGVLPTFNEGFTYTVEETDNGDGTFTVKIKSDSLPAQISFTDKTELLNVIWININRLTDLSNIFRGCTNVTNINTANWDTKNVSGMGYMFNNCNSLTTLDVSHFNTSKVTAMNSMFNGCTNLITLDVSNWNTESNINFGHMFYYCNSLVDLDVSNWNTSNATVIDNMFKQCNSLTNLDISNWNTSKFVKTDGAFGNCSALKELDLSKWNTSKIIEMQGMFKDCTSLTRLDLFNFDTNVVNNFTHMFKNCSLLESIDISNFIINEDASINNMFTGSSNLKLIRCLDTDSANKISTVLPDRTGKEYSGVLAIESKEGFTGAESMSAINWTAKDPSEEIVVIEYEFDKSICENLMPNITGSNPDSFIIFERENLSDNTFIRRILYYGDSAPTAINFNFEDGRQSALLRVINLEADHLTRADNMFKNCTNLIECNISGSMSNITRMDGMFYQCNNLTSLDVSDWDTSNVTNMYSMFWNCSKLTSLDVSNWDVGQVTTTSWMFLGCYKLVSLDLSRWETSSLTNAFGMFGYCYELEELDLSNWTVISAEMFYSCKALKKLKNAYNLTANSLEQTFYKCISLENIEGIETWDTSNVTTMQSMFNYCHKLISLNISNWDTNNVTNMAWMFQECQSLTSLDLSNWNTGNVTNMTYMFFNCSSLKAIKGIEDFDTKNCLRMEAMFNKCKSLTYLNLNKWNVENVTTINMMFADCFKLKEIKIDKWNLKNIESYYSLFLNCKSLISLTMSKNYNFINSLSSFAQGASNLKVLDFSNVSYDINDEIGIGNFLVSCDSLTDIALLNHNEKQIDHFIKTLMSKSWLGQHITFWVDKNIDLTKLEMNEPQYRTIKHYIEEDAREFYLTSPLLEGDRLEVVDGDLYHYHKMGHIILNGEESWAFNVDITASDEDNNVLRYNFYSTTFTHLVKKSDATRPLLNNFGFCGSRNQDEGIRITGTNIGLVINQDKLSPFITVEDPNGAQKANALKKWLSINPIDVVYELANPYYELIQENFDLIDLEKDNYFTIDGSTISINCQFDLCIIKPKYLYTDTLYKISFDANKASEISIDLGGTLSPMTIVEGHNEIVLTTPTTLSHGLLKVNGSTDIVIDNLMIIDSDKDFDSFEGINNTFDEKPVKNICSERTNTYIVGTDTNGEAPKIDLNETVDKGELVTVIGKLPSKKNLAKVVEGSEITTGNQNLVTIKVENGILKFSGINYGYKTYDLTTGELNSVKPYIGSNAIDYYKDFKILDGLSGKYTLSCRLTRKEVAPDLIGEDHQTNHNFITVGMVYDDEALNGVAFTCSDVMNNTDILKGYTVNISSHVNGIYVSTWYDQLHDYNDMELQIQLEAGNEYTKFEPYTDTITDKPIAINLYNSSSDAPTGKNLVKVKGGTSASLSENDVCYTVKNGVIKSMGINKGYHEYDLETGKVVPIYAFEPELYTFPYYKDKRMYIGTGQYAVTIRLKNVHFPEEVPNIYGTALTVEVIHDDNKRHAFTINKYIYDNYGETLTSQFVINVEKHINGIAICPWYSDNNYDNWEFEIQIEKGNQHTEFEPYRTYINDEPIIITPDENGMFAITINADRDDADQIALYIPNEEDYNVGDKIKVNDLMVFKGDLDDVYIPDWIDTDETNYLVEYKAFNNQFGFGKNKLI